MLAPCSVPDVRPARDCVPLIYVNLLGRSGDDLGGYERRIFARLGEGSSHNAGAGAPASEARGHRVPAVEDSAMNAPRAGAGEFSSQSGLLDAA
jgi:hypothetical protein